MTRTRECSLSTKEQFHATHRYDLVRRPVDHVAQLQHEPGQDAVAPGILGRVRRRVRSAARRHGGSLISRTAIAPPMTMGFFRQRPTKIDHQEAKPKREAHKEDLHFCEKKAARVDSLSDERSKAQHAIFLLRISRGNNMIET